MAKKKKYRLKIWIKFLLLSILLLTISYYAWDRYKIYQYHQTDEYKLLVKGYDSGDVSLILDTLNENQIDFLIEKDEKLLQVPQLLKAKYFLLKNYDKYLSYYEKDASRTIDDIVAIVNVGANEEWYSNMTLTDISSKNVMLVNKFHKLSDDYEPTDIKKFSSTYAYGTVSAETECYDAFIKMANDARKENVILVLSSGYRSKASQEKTYDDMAKAKGIEYADSYAARPRSSEHETGLALDILSNGKYIYTSNFHESDAYRWLAEHAHEYGFILRYPDEKQYITGYSPESWHYRYLGVDLATKVKKEGITYDEYYAYYLDNE